jgi:nicotinamidase-related amidase/O-acetyl-ADP-ribose deacetylase (regulator of RNase III)
MNEEANMVGGASLAVKKAGGVGIQSELGSQKPLTKGRSYITHAGSLKTKVIAHAIIMENALISETDLETISRAVRSALYQLDELKISRISITGMGTGFGGLDPSDAATSMMRTIKSYLDENGSPTSGSSIKEIRVVDKFGTYAKYSRRGWDAIHGKKIKPAILIIDLINSFVHSEGGFVDSSNREKLMSNVNTLLDLSYRRGVPVFFIVDKHNGENDPEFLRTKVHCTINAEASILPELHIQKEAHILYKNKYSSFYNTDLKNQLDSLGVNTLILAGVQAHVCVLSTALDAFYNAYRVIVVGDCTESSTNERKEFGLRYIQDYVGEVGDLKDVLELMD